MNSFSFYQISKSPIDKVLPSLLFKIYSTLKRPMLLIVESEDVKKYDELLWSFSTNKFLPHGTEADAKDYYKYLLITDKKQNINKADILMSMHEIPDEFAQEFKKVIYIFDQTHPNISRFKAKYSKEKEMKPKKTLYWFQDEKGKWQSES